MRRLRSDSENKDERNCRRQRKFKGYNQVMQPYTGEEPAVAEHLRQFEQRANRYQNKCDFEAQTVMTAEQFEAVHYNKRNY